MVELVLMLTVVSQEESWVTVELILMTEVDLFQKQ